MNFFYMIIIITALATAALTKGASQCNLSESTGAQQCLGAFGKPLIFFLPNSTYRKISLKKNADVILKVANNTLVTDINSKYSNRSAFFTNGTFEMDNVTKRDSGDYLLEIHGRNGELLYKINIHLGIQAPVSEPAVSQTCLSPEQMKVSCSSEGGEEFILTLDGNVLIQTRAGSTDQQHKPTVSNVTISLHGQLTGSLVCAAKNNVSSKETVIHLASCKDFTSHLSLVTVAVIASVATLFLLLALFAGIKHLKKYTRPMTANEDNAEDEIVYSDVRVMKHTRKT